MFGKKKKLLADLQAEKEENKRLILKIDNLTDDNSRLQGKLDFEKERSQRYENSNLSLKQECFDLRQKVRHYESLPDVNNVNGQLKKLDTYYRNRISEKNSEISSNEQTISNLRSLLGASNLANKALEKENKELKLALKIQVKKLTKEQSLEFERVERYYVELHSVERNKTYTLPADIIIISTFSINPENDIIKKEKLTYYFLSRVYWNNGGHISFENKFPRLRFNITIKAESDKGQLYEIKLKEDKVEVTKSEIERLKSEANKIQKLKDEVFQDIRKLMSDTENRFPVFSTLLSDYKHHINLKFANEIANKKNPALSSAEKIKALSKEIRNLEKKYKLLSYQMEIYESEFPWITDFKEVSVEEIEKVKKDYEDADSEIVYLQNYLSSKEYNSLSEIERYQLALDRYKKKHKTNWQVGIAFERYVGYLYEKKGYRVTYFGAQRGLEDLGRDLIAKKGDETLIIQCKYWNQHRTVHEKHIFQLFGTMFSYDSSLGFSYQTSLLNDNLFHSNIQGVFITTCPLSEKALDFAKRLQIEVHENFIFEKDYPCIKCNISGKTGEKIYHLPFDQQYDNVCIDFSVGEFYANTVKEAEENGFRRAFRWKPEK